MGFFSVLGEDQEGKKGGDEHEWHECSWSYQSTGRSIAQMTKAWCTGLSPANISVWVFIQKWTLEPKSFLKCIQSYPGHIYNINCKTAEKTFPNQSLMHLCHLANKNKLKCFYERKDRSWPLQKCLQSFRVLWWLIRFLLLSITNRSPVSNPRRTANECDLVIQSHQKLFCVTGEKHN